MLKKILLTNIFITFSLMVLGGVVHNTGSSLACPDWPLCYGSAFPTMEGGILFEHSHRLLGSLVGLLTILITLLAYRSKNRKLFKLALLILMMVITQGVLGGLTVIYKLPTIVSTTHLTLSMIFLCTQIYIFHLIQVDEKKALKLKLENDGEKFFREHWKPQILRRMFVVLSFLFIQIILGAFVRHSGSGAACGLGIQNAILCFDYQYWYLTLWPSLTQAQFQMGHRIFAIIIATLIVLLGKKIVNYFSVVKNSKNCNNWEKFYDVKTIIFFAYFVSLLILAQIVLGILTVSNSIGVVSTTLHLAVGALLLASLWYLFLKLKFVQKSHFSEKSHSAVSDIIQLSKPKLSGLVIFTVWIGMMMAPHHIPLGQAALALLFVSMNVWGAGTLNCYMEKELDKKMDRTKDRPLPAGRMAPKTALFFGLLLTIGSFFLILVFVNVISAILSLIALITYLFIYTPMKTNDPSAVLWGAIPGALPPLIGWTMIMGKIDYFGLILFGIIFVWQLPHFLSISIYHLKDYMNAGVKVLPSIIGIYATKIQIFVFTLVMVGLTALPWAYMGMGTTYKIVANLTGLIMIIISVIGLFFDSKSKINLIWARSYFLGSIIYLPLLLSAMAYFG